MPIQEACAPEPAGRADETALSKEDINALPLFHYQGDIRLVRSEDACLAAVEELRRHKALGLDTETRPSFRKGKVYLPSLIQLASPERIYLFQLRFFPLNDALAGVLENPRVVKAGVAVRDDLKALRRLREFAPAGVVDLGEMAARGGLAVRSLRGLAAHFLGVRISKGERCSNWSSEDLSSRQIRYAATDAWASLAIYRRMHEQGMT